MNEHQEREYVLEREIEELKAESATTWEALDMVKKERDEALNRLANERAKLVIAIQALSGIEEYWNRNPNERAMQDACDHAIETASAALRRINELEKQS